MRLVVALICAVGMACSRPAYTCAVDEQCVANGMQGRCEAQGFCSFEDAGCPSGFRFEANAGGDLGGTCVPEGNILPSCGANGQECCADDSCLDNMFCDGGTCRQCVTDVGHGVTHSCFLRYDNTIWCSGLNFAGQLGNGGTASVPTPIPVQVRDTSNAVITNAIAIAGAENYSCAIRDDNTVWCWGAGSNCENGGQLGDGLNDSSDVAVQVIKEADGEPLSDIVEVYGAFCHSCARDSAGGVWCWGDNDNGRLGDGTLVSKARAVQVLDAPDGDPITGTTVLGVGGDHSCVLTADNEVQCWGGNEQGMIGDDTIIDRPSPTSIGLTATSIAVGRFHTCAIKDDQTMVCWGRGRGARLGNGTPTASQDNQLTPQPVITALGGTPFGDVESIEMGAMSCAVTTAKEAWCWGTSNYGQTGTGGGTAVPAPVLDADGSPLVGVTKIRGRFNRACAFLETGEMRCWGRNSEGQLGDGQLVNHGLATAGAGPTCP